MSQENVELVRRGYAAYEKEGVEGVIPFFNEDAVLVSIPEWPDDPEYHGHDGGLRKLSAVGGELRRVRVRRTRAARRRRHGGLSP
jgi:ketosteroid isomerase-like protein